MEVQKKRKEDEDALTKLAHLESLKERLSRVEEEQSRKKIWPGKKEIRRRKLTRKIWPISLPEI